VKIGDPLVLIEGVAHSGTGQPLRYTTALYRGGRFRFIVDTTKPAQIAVEPMLQAAASR
jgi:hypothetical protein